MPGATTSWDVFLAHAGADLAQAEELYALLEGKRRVFLDKRCLLLGDDWDLALAEAQQAARVTAVLVSSKTPHAYYQREEIAAAIDMARRDSEAHRVVPVYLDGWPAERGGIPYGLRLKNGVDATAAGGMPGVAAALEQLLAQLDDKPPPAPPPQPAKTPPVPPPAAALPPRPQRFVGRDALAEQLTAAVLRDPAPSIVLLGPGGIGKSTLTLAALHRPEVATRFGARRWFVRLDAAPTAEAAVSLVATALGLPPRANPLAGVRAFLGDAPGVLALDNLETPWWGEREATEALLGELTSIPALVVVASVRGEGRPAGVDWQETIPVPRLEEDPAAELFCNIARAKRDDPGLVPLLARLEGVPAAITLLAHVAEGVSLAGVAREWEKKHTALLAKEGARPGRETSWAASMALSVESLRMTAEARRLLSLLGRLPDGVAFADLDALLPGEGDAATRTLVQVGLAYEEGERARVLAPVREYAREAVVPAAADLQRAMGHYRKLIGTFVGKVGREGGAEAITRLGPETANLDAMTREGLEHSDPGLWIDAVWVLTNFALFTGTVSPSLFAITTAGQVAHRIGATLQEARCISTLGELAFDRSDHEEARRHYDRGLALYRQAGDVTGEVDCIRHLGELALARSDHEGARCRYDEALQLCRQNDDVQGEATCILRLGELALVLKDYDEARRRFDDALPLYRRVGDVLGEANSIRRLGSVAAALNDREEARRRHEEALPLYHQVGDTRMEGNCIQVLGNLAILRRDLEEAHRRFNEALALYCRWRSVEGEADCIWALGDIAWERLEPETARQRYAEALGLYARIPDPSSMAGIHRHLARRAVDPMEKQHHVDTARALWTQIDRPDLVAKLDAEFPPPANPTPQSSPDTPSPPSPPDPSPAPPAPPAPPP